MSPEGDNPLAVTIMANELVLRLRFEAAQARKEIAEVRAALRGLKNEGGGGGRATAIGSGFTRAGASAQVNAYRVIAAAAKSSAAEAVAAEQKKAAAAKSSAAAMIAAEHQKRAAIQQATAEIQRQAAALRLAKLEQQGATGAVHQHTSALKQALTTSLQLAAAYGAIRAASAAFGAGIDYQAKLEGAKLAIASVVSANEKVIDAQGKQIEGVEKLKIAQDQVGVVMESLRVTAIKTGTPIQVLVAGFQAAVAPASAMGLSLKQTENVVVGLTNAMKAMNVPLDQQRQEIQDILNADIDRNSHVAKNLQLNSAVLNNWKSQGVLAERLLELLKDYNVAAGEFKNTWAGATAIMRGNFEALMGTMTSDSFKALKDEFKKLSEMFASDEARDEAKLYGRALADGLGAALEVSHAIADVLKSTSDGWMNLWRIVKGPEADIANFKAQTSTFKQVLDESYQSRVSRPSRMGANQLDPGVGAVSSQLSPEARAKIPNPRFEEDFESYQGRLAKVSGLSPQDRQIALQAHARSIVAGQNASNKVLGLEEAHVSTPETGSRQGVKILPGGGPGGVDPKITAKAKEDLLYDLSLARKKAHGDEVKGLRSEIAVYNKAIADVGKTGMDKTDLQRSLALVKEDLITATMRAAVKEMKAIEKAATKDTKGRVASILDDLKNRMGISDASGGGYAGQVREIDKTISQAGVTTFPPSVMADLTIKRNKALAGGEMETTKALGKGYLDSGSRVVDAKKEFLNEELGNIGRRTSESVAIGGLSDNAKEAMTTELEARKQGIEDEYAARMQASEELWMFDQDKSMELERDAERFKREGTAELLSWEKVERLRIAKEEGEARMAFAQSAANLLSGMLSGASAGSSFSSTSGMFGQLMDMAGIAGGPAVGIAGGLVGSVMDADEKQRGKGKAARKSFDNISDQARRFRGPSGLVGQRLGEIEKNAGFTDAKDNLRKTTEAYEKFQKDVPAWVQMLPGFDKEGADNALEKANKDYENAKLGFEASLKNEEAAKAMRDAAADLNKGFATQAADISLGTEYQKLDTARTSGKITEEQYLTGKGALDKKAIGMDLDKSIEGIAQGVVNSGVDMTGVGGVGSIEGAAKGAITAFQGGKSLEEVADMTTAWGGRMKNVFSTDALKNLAALAGSQGSSLESIDANLKAQLEKGTERQPMVIQPPRNSNFAFLDRNQLMGQQRGSASRVLNLAGRASAV